MRIGAGRTERAPRVPGKKRSESHSARSLIPLWLYLSLACGLAAAIGVFVRFNSEGWAHEWLPNIIPELGGLFVGVVVVGHLLERAARINRARERQPLRELWAHRIPQALSPLFSHFGALYPSLAEEGTPAPEVADTWAKSLDLSFLLDEQRLRETIAAISSTADGLSDARALGLGVLEPLELANLDRLIESLRRGASRLSNAHGVLGSTHHARIVLPHEGYAVSDDLPSTIASSIRDALEHVSNDYARITGSDLRVRYLKTIEIRRFGYDRPERSRLARWLTSLGRSTESEPAFVYSLKEHDLELADDGDEES